MEPLETLWDDVRELSLGTTTEITHLRSPPSATSSPPTNPASSPTPFTTGRPSPTGPTTPTSSKPSHPPSSPSTSLPTAAPTPSLPIRLLRALMIGVLPRLMWRE
ncbi:unnamed protein product [Rhodiola kirilowii]